MSIDEQQSTDEAEVLRPDAVAPVDEPEQQLYSDADGPDDVASSAYPDGPGASGGGTAGADPSTASPYPDGWGPDGAPHAHVNSPGTPAGAQYGGAGWHQQGPYVGYEQPYMPTPYGGPGSVAQFDPAADFEPPEDLPPWYEDEYYDDRDWERMPRSSSTLFRVLLFLGGFAVVLLISGFYVKGWVDDQRDPPGEEGVELAIQIPQGATTNDIARILDEEGVIANGTVFRYYLRYKDAGDFQAGEYTFNTNMAVWDARAVLESGARTAETFFVTVPEGLRVTEIEASLLSQLPRFDATELSDALAAVRKPQVFEDNVLFSTEGFLFPDTYEIGEAGETNEAALLERKVTRFDQVAVEVDLASAQEKVGVSPYQALIVASLIEEEARADEDRAKIARVIYNRLEAGWTLGIDATVVYALGGDRELSASDLDVDSPYNTRKFTGLPPTPIAAPGKLSLEAALNPADGDWFYYVLTEENGPGTHTFAVTEEQFSRAVQVCIERDLGCG